MLAARDRLTGVDVMAMDFAAPPAAGATRTLGAGTDAAAGAAAVAARPES